MILRGLGLLSNEHTHINFKIGSVCYVCSVSIMSKLICFNFIHNLHTRLLNAVVSEYSE